MTWKELKELAEEAGVKDDIKCDVMTFENESKEDLLINEIKDGIWYLQ